MYSRVVVSGDFVEVFRYEKPVVRNLPPSFHKKKLVTPSSEQVLLNRKLASARAVRNVYRLVSANSYDCIPDCAFLTLTFRENIIDLTVAAKELRLFLQRLSYLTKVQYKYVIVPEFQVRGAVHYHCLFFNWVFVQHFTLRGLWGVGSVDVHRIDRVRNLARYVTKYMVKGFVDSRVYNRKKYYASRNLRRPLVILSGDSVTPLDSVLMDSKMVYQRSFNTRMFGSVSVQRYMVSSEVTAFAKQLYVRQLNLGI